MRFQLLNYSILLILIYLVVFLKIDTFHLRWWDESMFAVNTYEMAKNGHPFSLYFNGVIDISNSKPPLTVWVQVAFTKLFGYNEVALRLPSAIAAALSIIMTFRFTQRRFGWVFAWLSALVLITSQAFIGFHSARTADSDSLLTLFTLAANIYFFKYIEEGKSGQIFLFFLFISLGFCTKLYASLLFVPAYFFILIHHKKLKAFVFSGYFWSGVLLLLVTAVGIIILRDLDSPGYLREAIFKDAGRIFRVIEGHRHTWEYYIDNLIFTRYAFWFLIMIISSVLILINHKETKDRLFVDMLLLICSYFSIISISITKLEWYDIPLYPYFAIVSAYGLKTILETRFDLSNLNRTTVIVLIVIFCYPYWLMFRKAQANTIPNNEKKSEASERFLFKRSNGKSNLEGIKVYNSNWEGSLIFYKYKFREKGENITITRTADFSLKDKVLVSNDSLYDVLKSKYQFKLLDGNSA
ncbi:MAG: glycosyltransferase family 39 protein [bacterium]|nr:glycosyltransferase family 39 protein [bacterium]